MAENKSVTLTKNNRKITLTIPRDIVEYKAAGWREEVPEADSPQDTGPKADDAASKSAPKGGSRK